MVRSQKNGACTMLCISLIRYEVTIGLIMGRENCTNYGENRIILELDQNSIHFNLIYKKAKKKLK
jgi:hypothetical protein